MKKRWAVMIQFDTLDKKPKVWNIAILSGIVWAVVIGLMLLPGSHPVLIEGILIAYFALVIVFLLNAFVKQIHYNPYSYNTIYYLGFSLFVLSILITHIVLTIRLIRHPDWYAGNEIDNILGMLLGSAKTYMIFSSPFILIFSLGLCISNISLIRHERKRLVNVLGIILSFLLVGGEVFLFTFDYYTMGSLTEVLIHELVVNLFAAVYLYFECMLIGTIIANIIVVRYEPDRDKDFVIILGCGIRKDGSPTPLLKGRVDRAIRFREKQLEETGKDLIFVTSGGQGPNEVTSESASMKGYLLEQGIPEDRIIEENQSASTFENMKYSKEKILAVNSQGKVAFSTTNYHVFRSGLFARRVKMRAVGMGARTKWYFWPNAAVREFVGLLTEHRVKQGLIFGGMILTYVLMTIVVYMM
ncbi:MAG: YdcF family protein [Eubacterium sp.]|nr:YdcF family protein [Eubacterium sp.]